MDKEKEDVPAFEEEEEEEMIDKLFFKCDINNEGRVKVQTVIQYLTNCLGNENNESELLELSRILEAESLNGTINYSSYKDGVKHWIIKIKSRCDSNGSLEMEAKFRHFSQDSLDVTSHSVDRSHYSIEASGVNDGSFHLEQDSSELLSQIEDLKFANHKLSEENGKLYSQLEAQEEAATGLATELHNKQTDLDSLKKKMKSLHELTDLQKSVMEENEELKSRLAGLHEQKRVLDRKLADIEAEKVASENQAKHWENMWQKSLSDLDKARCELQNMNTLYSEQKQQLIQTQESKLSHQDVMTQKDKEIEALNEKLKEAMAHNEKLQEGKDEVQQRLTQANTKFLRAQSKVELLTDGSMTEEEQIGDFSRQSPRIKFSTPRMRNSICMELKDRLKEDRHLPSPLCEKMELSNDWPLYRRSVVLPPYMSAWDLELSNTSQTEYSLDLKKNRKSLSPGYFEKDMEKKLTLFKDLDKDAIQKEMIKMYRVNLDLAERCHKAELRENELQEQMTKSTDTTSQESLRCQQLEESLESLKASQELELKDLWRLVHSQDEDDTDISEKSCVLSASTEQLKLQIKHEVEALRKKLLKKEAALGTLKSEKNKVLSHSCKGRPPNSPLVDALNIECVQSSSVDKYHRSIADKGDCAECASQHSDINSNRSVPMLRRHHKVHAAHKTTRTTAHTTSHMSQASCPGETSSDMDLCDNKLTDLVNNKNNKNIPFRFTFDKCSESEASTREMSSVDEKKQIESGHLFRRKSYLKAIQNHPATSGEDIVNQAADTGEGGESRGRSYSFQTAIEQGQISPTGPPQTPDTCIGDTTPDNESPEPLQLNGGPKFSSTPYQLPKSLTKSVNFHPATFIKDTSSKLVENGAGDVITDIKTESQTHLLLQHTDLVKPIHPNRSSMCNPANLSVLLEEDASGIQSLSSDHEQGTNLTGSSGLEPSCNLTGSSGHQEDFSVEMWTLSRTDSSQSNSCSSKDSGHSSSITGLDGEEFLEEKKELNSPRDEETDKQNQNEVIRRFQDMSNDRIEQEWNEISQTEEFTKHKPLSPIKKSVSFSKKSVDFNSKASVGKMYKSEKEIKDSARKVNAPNSPVTDSARNLSPSQRILLRFSDRQMNNKHSSVSKDCPVSIPNKENMVVDRLESTKSDKLQCARSPRLESTKLGKLRLRGTVDSEEEEEPIRIIQKSDRLKDFKISHTEEQHPPRNMKIGPVNLEKSLEFGKMKLQEPNNNSKAFILEDEEDSEDSGQGLDHKSVSNLAKIRQSHLARRHQRTTIMPQLSELSEKETSESQNSALETDSSKSVEDGEESMTNGDVVMPNIPDKFLQKLGLTTEDPSSDELTEQEIENKFSSLSLAFKTDAQTLEKRLEIQERSRDIAEQNVDKELQGLRTGLATLNQICTDPQVREVLAKIQNHIDILEKSTARVSSRAEVYGAIQQEKRMSKAVDIMVQHVENIRRVHEREHAELEEARKLLQDSRSLGPTTLDIAGGDLLSRRANSVCQNNMFAGKFTPGGAPIPGGVNPSALKAVKLLKASRGRRVSEVALPKVLGGVGAPNLYPSASMDLHWRTPSTLMSDLSIDEEEDARSRFKAAVASTSMQTAITNTLRRASMEKQNSLQSTTAAPTTTTPQVSRDNSADSANKTSIDAQEKEKQKNLEEEAFKKGYEQGLRANLGKDLTGLREQQNHINESLGDIMDTIDSQMEEPKSLKEILVERFHENIPKVKISGWRIRMTMGGFFIVMAFISIIISLFPGSSANFVDYHTIDRPLV